MTKPAGQRAIAGDRLRDVVTASAWNALMDMLDQWRRSSNGAAIPELPPDTQPCSVLVRNDTGDDLSRWATVGLSGVTVEPSVNADEFEETHVLKAVLIGESHATKFAVLQEDIPDGEIGAAVVCGVTLATVDAQSTDDGFARPKVGTQRLESVSAGNIRILHVESAGDEQLALVLLLASGAGVSANDENPCCGCPPTQCYPEYEDVPPPIMVVDFGDLTCCDDRAGGVKELRWNGSAWASPLFWCDPAEGGTGNCGTSTWEWSTDPGECDNPENLTAQFSWTPGPGPDCTGGSWTQETACPDGCVADETELPDWPSNPCTETTRSVSCVSDATPTGHWVIVSDNCTCDGAATPPATDGTTVGEQRTTNCPGSPDEPPADIPCTGGNLDGVVWSGELLSEAGDLLYMPGTALWTWNQMDGGMGFGYQLSWNGCDPLEDAHPNIPAFDPLDNGIGLCPGSTIPTGYDTYVITACSGEPCPPDGYVSSRWVLVPPTGYEGAKLELRVGGVVKIRYVMPANRTFCQECYNRMEIEQSDCSWPCDNIPEFVCVRPAGGRGGTCVPLANSYSMTVPSMTVANPAIGGIDAGQMGDAAGSYVLDLIDNAGWDPRHEENGCGSNDITCCTWRAPYSSLAASEVFCDLTGGLGWVLQTCDPEARTGLTAKSYQNYDCAVDSPLVLRFGINSYENVGVEEGGLVGPAVIRWTRFKGTGWSTTGAVCCADGYCLPENPCSEDVGNPFYPGDISQTGYWLTWVYKETQEDGTIVMRMEDADYAGWVTAFPQEIELTPVT